VSVKSADCSERPTPSVKTTKTIRRQQMIATYETERTSGLSHPAYFNELLIPSSELNVAIF